jgi:hypothetical protein
MTISAMYRLLILTADRVNGSPDSSIEVHREDGTISTYLFVDRVDQLVYYRRDSVPEVEARQLIG